MADIATGLVYYVVFLFSTTLHEAAHAWAAKRGGDETAYLGGQVSLDPMPHIRREPFGMVILPLITVLISGWPFGYASAPYDPRWAYRYPRRAALMALAGPAANLLIVIAAALLLRLGVMAGVFYVPDIARFGDLAWSDAAGLWPAIATTLSIFFSLNLLLAMFNLLPLPPLDGSGAIPLVLSEKTSRAYQMFLWSNPALGWIGILIAWQVFAILFAPIFWGAVDLLYLGI